jgi:hypothetical protein
VSRSGYGRFTIHVWVFEAAGEEYKKFRLELTSLETGKTVAALEAPVKRQGPYYQALLIVKAKPGKYLLRITDPVNLKIEMEEKPLTLSITVNNILLQSFINPQPPTSNSR